MSETIVGWVITGEKQMVTKAPRIRRSARMTQSSFYEGGPDFSVMDLPDVVGPPGPQSIQGGQRVQDAPGIQGPQGDIGPDGPQGDQGQLGDLSDPVTATGTTEAVSYTHLTLPTNREV